ncbi:hypothetical protein Kisp02_54730 [Kineosporia sp. NBRC 101731]|nr:hypothetical protein Kisp02_54730 [Kineosporia sp. NBRC 101731]
MERAHWATRWLNLTAEQKTSQINADSLQAFVDGPLERACIRWAAEDSEPGSRWRP